MQVGQGRHTYGQRYMWNEVICSSQRITTRGHLMTTAHLIVPLPKAWISNWITSKLVTLARSKPIDKMTMGMRSFMKLGAAVTERRISEAQLRRDMAKFRPFRIAATIGNVLGLIFNLVILCSHTWMIGEGNYLIFLWFMLRFYKVDAFLSDW